MAKQVFKPGTMLNPVPAVMVSCGDARTRNIITVAWTGIVNSEPPMTYVSIRKERHSHDIIARTGEFVINLTTEKLAYATDYCGVRSGRDVDKFKEQNLTAVPAQIVSCPMIAESPVNIECRVTEIKELGSHDMFLAEIVSVSAEEALMDENGRFCLEDAGLIAYNHGHYFALKKTALGRFGFSVMKPKTRKRLDAQRRAAKQSRKARHNSMQSNSKNR